MEKLTNKEFITPTVLIASVYSGFIYNFFMMYYKSVLDGSWSILTNNKSLANILAIVFILFTLILILSIRYTEKINQKLPITLILLAVGVCCLVTAGLWTLEWFILGFIVIILAIAYLTPTLFNLSTELVGPDPERDYYTLVYPISIILWIGISGALFYLIEDELVWRFLYIITGCLNISGALIISNP